MIIGVKRDSTRAKIKRYDCFDAFILFKFDIFL